MKTSLAYLSLMGAEKFLDPVSQTAVSSVITDLFPVILVCQDERSDDGRRRLDLRAPSQLCC